jgi:hypothetical protein
MKSSIEEDRKPRNDAWMHTNSSHVPLMASFFAAHQEWTILPFYRKTGRTSSFKFL